MAMCIVFTLPKIVVISLSRRTTHKVRVLVGFEAPTCHPQAGNGAFPPGEEQAKKVRRVRTVPSGGTLGGAGHPRSRVTVRTGPPSVELRGGSRPPPWPAPHSSRSSPAFAVCLRDGAGGGGGCGLQLNELLNGTRRTGLSVLCPAGAAAHPPAPGGVRGDGPAPDPRPGAPAWDGLPAWVADVSERRNALKTFEIPLGEGV